MTAPKRSLEKTAWLLALWQSACVGADCGCALPREAPASPAAAFDLSGPVRIVEAACTSSAAGGAGAAETRGALAGRFFEAADGAQHFAWSGTTLAARFEGSAVYLRLEDSGKNQFYVIVDGIVRPQKLVARAGRHCYELARGLNPGQHDVSLYRLTEAGLGQSASWGFSTPAPGRMLAPPAAVARRIEVIGDSISAAYGIEGTSKECHFSPDTENHYESYAALLGRSLHAEVRTIAWSGKGIFSNRGSKTDTVPMPPLWERTLPEQSDSRWDFKRWQPHAVVINLGTNDFAPETPDKTPFAAEYTTFLRRIRAVYPEAWIVAVIGPLLSDVWPPEARALSLARQGVRSAIDALGKDGDTRISLVEHAQETESEGFGCDWHPTARVHARLAQDLIPELKAKLGW